MTKEINIGSLFPEMSYFIDVTYPTTPEEIQKQIDEAKRHETKYLRASDYLIIEALGFEAERVGVENLPAMLGAVIRLEADLPPEKRKLTPQKYLQLMVKGELRSAVTSANAQNIKDVELHTKNATILNGFLKDFE